MLVHEFLSKLKDHQDLPLNFVYPSKFKVRSDFHITEVKTLHIESVDCGGQYNQWDETLVQLWETKNPDPNHRLSASKALSIIEKVDQVKALNPDTEVKIEYSGDQGVLAIYFIDEIKVDENGLSFVLTPEKAACKAIDRGQSCGPTEKVKLELATVGNDCCEPSSGCCN